MPPKKGATKAESAASEAPTTLTTRRGREIPTSAAAARPRRAIATAPTEKAVTTKRAAAPKTTAAKATTPAAGKKRGRPATTTAKAEFDDDAHEPPKKRGRPAKNAPAVSENEVAPPKKRGRPPKGGETTKVTVDEEAAAEQLEEELVDVAEAEDEAEAAGASKPSASLTKKKPGRPAKGKAEAATKKTATAVVVNAAQEEAEGAKESGSTGKRYWLMKAEQEDREETLKDGSVFNTKFTIDDLRNVAGPEPWDGVRNPTACKNMKEMKLGDLAFFYASGGKKGRVPGIVGIMEIVKEAEMDPGAFDETNPYFVENPKIRGTEEKPRWYMVHVEYRKKLSKVVPLKELQKFSDASGVLANMQELKAARLSVSKVTEEEWNFIIDNLVEGYEDEVDGFSLPKGDEEVSWAKGDTAMPDIVEDPAPALPHADIIETTESDPLTTNDNTSLAPETAATSSRPASRAGSKKPASRPSSRAGSKQPTSRAGSLAPPRANSRAGSREPRGSSAQPTIVVPETAMDVIRE